MKAIKKIIIGIVAFIVLASALYFSGFRLEEEPDWFPFVTPEVQEMYWDYVEQSKQLQLLSSSGTPFPDPDKSMILDVTAFSWWVGDGCVPDAIGMVYLYYDNHYGTNYLGSPINRNKPNGDPATPSYQYLATESHLHNCFGWNTEGDNPWVKNADCSSSGPCDNRPNLCLADFFDTCGGSTSVSCYSDLTTNMLWHFYAQTEFCNWRGLPVPILTRYRDVEYSGSMSCPVNIVDITYDFLKQELNEGRPIAANIEGHYVTIIGWSEDYSNPSYDSPQLIINPTFNADSYMIYEFDRYDVGDHWWIYAVDFMDFGIDTSNPVENDGDMNGNGIVNVADCRYLAKHLGGDPEYAILYADGDVNCNGVINANDVRYLAMYLLEIPEYMPLYPTC